MVMDSAILYSKLTYHHRSAVLTSEVLKSLFGMDRRLGDLGRSGHLEHCWQFSCTVLGVLLHLLRNCLGLACNSVGASLDDINILILSEENGIRFGLININEN